MEITNEKTYKVLPRIQFADACCEDCMYLEEYDGSYFADAVHPKIKCERDGKWHRWNDVCKYFVES